MAKRGKIRWIILLVVWIAVACQPQEIPDGPQLVREVTVAPTDLVPTQAISATSPPTVTPTRNSTEFISPLLEATVDAQFVVITPTLPPSKTPTITPSFTPTPTVTPSPTMTNTATSTAFLLPTSEIIEITQVAIVPTSQVCDTVWQFIQPPPPACPAGPPNASRGTYQRFPNGHMIEVGNQSAIYVLYNDAQQPRWQVFRDYFQEGMPETSPEYPAEQPIRGFGMLWRDNATVRNRLGYLPTQRYEAPYNVILQTARDGSIYVNGQLRGTGSRFADAPPTFTFVLFPNNANWRNYDNQVAPPPVSGPTAIPPLGF